MWGSLHNGATARTRFTSRNGTGLDDKRTLTVPAILRDMERGRMTLAMSYTSL